jgi:hypothetical protein
MHPDSHISICHASSEGRTELAGQCRESGSDTIIFAGGREEALQYARLLIEARFPGEKALVVTNGCIFHNKHLSERSGLRFDRGRGKVVAGISYRCGVARLVEMTRSGMRGT